MPLINLRISSKEIENEEEFLKELSSRLAKATQKPEKYVMCILQTNVCMSFGGSSEPSCFIEIKSIGSLNPKTLSEEFCNLIEERIGIPSERIYLEFEDIEASRWGYNKSTFG